MQAPGCGCAFQGVVKTTPGSNKPKAKHAIAELAEYVVKKIIEREVAEDEEAFVAGARMQRARCGGKLRARRAKANSDITM